MARLGKYLTVYLIVILAAASLLMVLPTNAQTIPKPSVPQFTVTYVDLSYDEPTSVTTSIDPYTGEKTTTTHEGYHVNSQNITLLVKNQPFTAPIGNNTYHLCYNVITKGHFEEGNWQDTVLHHEQSEGEYTTISFQSSYSANSQIDIRVIALIVHDGQQIVWGPAMTSQEIINSYVCDITSDWSQILTLNLANGSSIVSEVPTPKPTIPELPITATLTAVLAAVSLLLIIGKKKLRTF